MIDNVADSWLLEIIRCPLTLESLTIAPTELINQLRSEQSAGRLFNRLGVPVSDEIQGGLVNASRSWFFANAGAITSLLPDQAIPLSNMMDKPRAMDHVV